MKKVVLFVIFILTVFIISGCKNDVIDRGFLYSYDEIATDLKVGQVLDFTFFENKLILVGIGSEEVDGFSYPVIRAITLNIDGNIISDVKLDEINGYLANVDSLGRIWVIGSKKNQVYGMKDEYVIMCFNHAGNLIKTIDLDKENGLHYANYKDSLVVGLGYDKEVYFYFLEGSFISIEGRLGELIVLNENGKKIELNNKSNDNIMDLFRLKDGRVFVRTLDNGALEDPKAEMSISCVCIECSDICNKEQRAKAAELANTFSYTFLGGSGDYDMIMVSRLKVYGSNLKGERTELLNWTAESVNITSTYKHTIMADDLLYTLTYVPSSTSINPSDGKTIITKLTKAGALKNDNNRKKIINVATLYTDEKFMSVVANFNKTNPDYRVEVKAYSDSRSNRVEDDVINAFNIDLTAGYIPDMVFLARNSPNLGYAAKGLFADLNKLMDNDPDFDKNDYLTNIFKLLEANGKLNFGTTSFSITTLMGRVSEWGERLSFTWNEYDAFLEGRPDNILPIGTAPDFAYDGHAITKEEFLSTMLTQKMGDFVNFETGTCSFENLSFTQLLKKTDRFPLNREDYTAPMDFHSSNPPLLWLPYFYAFDNMSGFHPQSIKANSFGEEIIYIGVPTDEVVSNGSICNPRDLFAIFESAKEKGGAWEFAKYLLIDFQETAGAGLMSSLSGFPVKNSALEFLVREAKKKDTYETWGVLPPTDREIERVLELVHSLDYINLTDDFIMNIIIEEAYSYFTGQKTPEQVAVVVQNRVSLYLKEIN
ncbi:MAG: ABC transporter substrate-binding protein [Lachnospiraceae bacterium]|nr:ABC transporter substrate-binding protein [Lachnospiraceae bacterium]